MPAVDGEHGIKTNRPVGMERYPVIGEYRVGGVGFLRIIHHQHLHIMAAQQCRQPVEFLQCMLLKFGFGAGLLERIVDRRLFVESKTNGPYH